MTVQQVIDAILALNKLPQPLEPTCDILVSGDPATEVKGIVTTFMATVDVINRAAALGANLIITHEPTWFTGRDSIGWLEDDPVYQAKKQLLDGLGIAVWRYHDHMHMLQPDGIYEGIVDALGWAAFAPPPTGSGESNEMADYVEHFRYYYDIPSVTLEALAEEIKQKLEMKVVRLIGRTDMPCHRVGILVGGGSLGLGVEEMPARVMQRHDIDVLLCGDITEWTLSAYVNDARQLGQDRAMIIAGHERTEEWGMRHMAGWLPKLLSGTPVHFVSAGEPFSYQ